MTSETPCPPGCREWPTYPSNGIGWANSDGVSVTHVPNCPNAKPAEPPACKCGHGKPPHEMDDSCGECTASKCACDRYDPKQEPQSEPTIDLDTQYFRDPGGATAPTTEQAWGSLKEYLCRREADRDALPADWFKDSSLATWFPFTAKELADLKAENAALKARMEELSESLLWATSSYEERVVILANREKRKEQENTNAR